LARIGEKILANADVDADLILSQSDDEDRAIPYVVDADIIVSEGAHQITGKMLEAAKKCKLVIRGGVGVDMIDVDTATKLG